MSEMSRHLVASGDDFIEDRVRRLATAQDRVAARLGRLTGEGWDVPANEVALEGLLTRGHFLDHTGELELTPRQIAGHLRDAARIFTDQIARLRTETDAEFEDFDTTAEERVASYAEIEPDDLTAELDVAHRELRGALGSIDPEELDNSATHETQGEVTLTEVVDFLPVHWEEHADQLEAVTAEAIV